MKIKILTLITLVGILAFSCDDPVRVEHKTAEQDHSKHQEHEVKEVTGLELNEGEKWEANRETHEGMHKIKTIIEASTPATLDDFYKMRVECNNQTSYIINNCSMTGEAHNQLHFVLHPILDNIKELKEAESITQGEKAYKTLSKNIADYFTFFKI